MAADAAPARELLRLGRAFHDRGSLEEARALFDAAAMTARALGDRRSEAEARSEHGRSLFFFCEPRLAGHLFEEARAAFEAVGDEEQTTLADLRIAFTAYDAGDLDRAGARLDRIGLSLRSREQRGLDGLLSGYRGNVARASGDYAEAAGHYERAVAMLEHAGDRRYAATFRMDAGILALASGEPEQALAGFAEARRVAESGPPDYALRALLDHYTVLAAGALGERALMRRAADRFDGPASPALEFLASTHRASLDAKRDLAALETECPSFEHGRLSVLILRRALHPRASELENRRLVLSETSRSIRFAGIEIELASRAPLYRIVLALSDAAERRDARSVSIDDLVAAAWPGERIAPPAAKNRLHVALATLRRMGLANAIRRDDGGYAFARQLAIVRAP
jgi:hypothetical protein